jgi:hypothetical protein
MAGWHMRYGSWWAVQWSWDRWCSLGVHVDWAARHRAVDGMRYGPYIDVHLGPMIASFGVQPIYSSDVERTVSVSRGGLA